MPLVGVYFPGLGLALRRSVRRALQTFCDVFLAVVVNGCSKYLVAEARHGWGSFLALAWGSEQGL